MSKQKPVKHLVIEIQYRDNVDLENVLTKIRSKVRSGTPEHKDTKANFKYEYGLCYLQEFDCRIEIINEKECMVIPSKINQK